MFAILRQPQYPKRQGVSFLPHVALPTRCRTLEEAKYAIKILREFNAKWGAPPDYQIRDERYQPASPSPRLGGTN